VVNAGKGHGVIYPGEHGLCLLFSKEMAASRVIKDFGVEFQGMSVLFPAIDGKEPEPLLGFECAVKIGTTTFKTRAVFNDYYRELSLTFCEFPSLGEMIQLLGEAVQRSYFPQPLSSLLTAKLKELRIVFSLAAESSVAEISFELTTENKIVLLEDIIAFTPDLEMRIYAPFDEEFRTIEGELSGKWLLGKTGFQTVLYYPSFDFVAGMAAGQTLDLGDVVKSLLSGISLKWSCGVIFGTRVFQRRSLSRRVTGSSR
jgi:hypothetical protein